MIRQTRALAANNQQAREVPAILKFLIVAQAFTAFLTETKFLPLRHNVGPFEVASFLTSIAVLIYFANSRLPLRFHRVMLPLLLMIVFAGLSNYKIMSDQDVYTTFRLLSLAILVVSVILVATWYNLFLIDERSLDLIFRALTYSAAIIALWVLKDQLATGGAASASGPFRNRAHAGIYMHTAFWLILMRSHWPRVNRLERLLTYPVMASLLYVIAGAGRRSIYIALGFGLVLLAIGATKVEPVAKKRIAVLVTLVVVAMGFMYFKASEFWKPAAFFKSRVEMVDDRVSTFSGLSGEETDDSFVLSQREAALNAFKANPFLGIGYGGFARWEGNPTKHEMHSTPFRFLAEMGAIGAILYVWFMLEILAAGVRAWRKNSKGIYGAPSLVLMIAVLCLSLSYVYNRQMTDRTFWLVLVVVIVMDTLAKTQAKLQKSTRRRSGLVRGPVRQSAPRLRRANSGDSP